MLVDKNHLLRSAAAVRLQRIFAQRLLAFLPPLATRAACSRGFFASGRPTPAVRICARREATASQATLSISSRNPYE